MLKRGERRVLVWWIRFAQKHRDSSRLPIVLFLVLFMDGFTIIVPSTLCLIAATTISPQRWHWFAAIFATAATSNNAVMYFVGQSVPSDFIVRTVEFFHLTTMWASAQTAMYDYGPWATFMGAIIGLPTQMIMAIMGMNDAHLRAMDATMLTSFVPGVTLALLAHSMKAFGIAALARFGWVRLEKKFGNTTSE